MEPLRNVHILTLARAYESLVAPVQYLLRGDRKSSVTLMGNADSSFRGLGEDVVSKARPRTGTPERPEDGSQLGPAESTGGIARSAVRAPSRREGATEEVGSNYSLPLLKVVSELVLLALPRREAGHAHWISIFFVGTCLAQLCKEVLAHDLTNLGSSTSQERRLLLTAVAITAGQPRHCGVSIRGLQRLRSSVCHRSEKLDQRLVPNPVLVREEGLDPEAVWNLTEIWSLTELISSYVARSCSSVIYRSEFGHWELSQKMTEK